MLDKLLRKLNLTNIDLNRAYEIRIRENAPVIYFENNKKIIYLNDGKKVIFNKIGISKIVEEITEGSYYSFEEQFAKGFLNYHGAKIALSGEVVYENGVVKTIKNITSVTIRIPKRIEVVSKKIASKAYGENQKSVIIVGIASSGKTTYLRDLISRSTKNISVIDERGELYLGENSLGKNADILTYASKITGVEFALRGLNPDIIACDEIWNEQEIEALKKRKAQKFRCSQQFTAMKISCRRYLKDYLTLR